MKSISKLIALLIFFCSLFVGDIAFARVKVVATIPDFGSIAKEIGGDKVKVKTIIKGYQNPHFVDAKPNYILWLNKADLLIYNGLDLEIGWLPILITGSRNSKITSMDSVGHLNASTLIPNILEKPKVKVDRSMGDVHPGGNSHYNLDPRNGIYIAQGIADRLKMIDPDNSSFYEANLQEFSAELLENIKIWESKIKPYEGAKIVTYHKSWTYFSDWAGFSEFGYIEPKPGIPPSPSHVADLIKKMKEMNLNMVLSESFYPKKTASLVAEKTGSTLLVLPTMVGGSEGVNTYFELFDKLVGDITSAVKN
ncbi:MAG: zinc ABC transporter solute-binding protein [Candidatus Dadabacteria bacterium]|nr:zinc ABC transporter substrate-binding protein [Candidatus Dadabacteria bacterium]NIX14451.1 zinc ABC transporter solute-binding protein [Candidatus Dadabacteria bacterium]NIY20939.1 zinc ABC transporter solute-binding protein [Candidatus Dadabacteria bacterium]